MKINSNRVFDPCSIYVLLWLFGHVQSMFLSSSMVSLLLYIPFLGMTLFYIAKTFIAYQPKGVMSTLAVFFLLLVLYGVALLLLDNATGQDRKSFLMMLFGSLGPIFAFYVFTQQGLLTEKKMRVWFFIFLVVTTIGFYDAQRKGLAMLQEKGADVEEITNNASYGFLALLPFVFLFRKKPVLQFVLIGFIMFFLISGFKRGAILTGLLMVLWFVFFVTKTASKGRRALFLTLTIVIIIIGWRFISQFYESSEYFQYRVESTMEGSTSNRDWIYSTLWNHYINNNNIIQLAFGEGAFHTENIIGYKAHNDWLELLIDCGLFGVIIYLVYWFYFIKDWNCYKKKASMVYSLMGSCLIFSLTRTFFSMSFGDMPFCCSMIMGYCFAQVSNPTIHKEEL